jgi:hypothetical protein
MILVNTFKHKILHESQKAQKDLIMPFPFYEPFLGPSPEPSLGLKP